MIRIKKIVIKNQIEFFISEGIVKKATAISIHAIIIPTPPITNIRRKELIKYRSPAVLNKLIFV